MAVGGWVGGWALHMKKAWKGGMGWLENQCDAWMQDWAGRVSSGWEGGQAVRVLPVGSGSRVESAEGIETMVHGSW